MSAAPRRAVAPLPGLLLAALVLCVAAARPADIPARPPSADPPPPRARAGSAHVIIETIAIDRRGTWSVGIDEADLRSGTEGILERSATLIGKQASAPREMVQATVRVTPVLQVDGACALRVDSEVVSVASGTAAAGPGAARPERRTAAFQVAPDQERLAEIFTSSKTQARLALKIRCAEALVDKAPDARFASFLLSIDRGDQDGALTPLQSNGMRAAVGREASSVFAFNVPVEESPAGGRRYRREQLEVRVAPVLIQEGRLQMDLRVSGELATVSAREATVTHPIDHDERVEIPSGGTHVVDLEIASSGGEEGWSKVRYRLTLVVTF